MSGSTRSSADLNPRQRRLMFHAWHRGTREMDLLMGRFADAHISDLSDEEMSQFEALIDVPDRDLFSWLSGTEVAPTNYATPLFMRLKAFHTHGAPIHI